MKKAIIFDIGEVVAAFHFADLYKIFANKTGISLEVIRSLNKQNSDVLTLGTMTKEVYWKELQKYVPDKTILDLEMLWIAEGMNLVEINDELVKWIQANRGVYTIGALTNLYPTRLLLDEKLNLAQYFDFTVLSCVEHLKKPDPAFYELALKKAGVEAKDAVFIDDDRDYVDAAKQIGFKDILFTDNESLFASLNNL